MSRGKRVVILTSILIILSAGFFLFPEENPKDKESSITGYAVYFNESKEDYDLLIEDEPYNSSKTYEGTKEVIIEHRGEQRIEFDWDFANDLNLNELEIKNQRSNDDFGYTVVNGLDFSKTVIVDKKIEESDAICIREGHISNISKITDSCSSSKETPLRCAEFTTGDKSCTIAGDTFVVSGVTGSAIKEFYKNESESNISLPDTSNCTPNWSCEEWSECIDGEQIRVCYDENSCGTNESKPEEERNCSQECIPDWVCDEWSECDENDKQTRECEDTNNCGTQQDKPEEERDCSEANQGENEKIDLIANIIFYTLVALTCVIFILIIYIILKEYFFPYSSFSLVDGKFGEGF